MGILAGHLGFAIDPQMLTYAESFGLVLFVYALGLQVGPGFFSSLQQGGYKLNMLGLGVILLGTIMAVALTAITPISMPDMVGILCGATTNTPALGCCTTNTKTVRRINKWSCTELCCNIPVRCRWGYSGYYCSKEAFRSAR